MSTTSNTFVALGQHFAQTLGAHHRMPMIANGDTNEWNEAARASARTESLLRYLAMHLADRHAAVTLCNAAGAPGYINYR